MTTSKEALTRAVERFFLDHARDFGLVADTLEVHYVASRGGFVNRSFGLSDGRRHLHLKLAVATEEQAALERWHGVARLLERYHAPPVLDHLEVGGASGLLFPRLPGSSPACTEEVVRAVLPTLRALWSDDRIPRHLSRGNGRSARDCYLDGYHDRFVQDLRGIRRGVVPFLANGDLDFMEAEVEALLETVEADPRFDVAVTAPIHGDLWMDNVLWESEGAWHVVDWDELQLGDPALDLVMLTGPEIGDPTPLKHVAGLERELDRDVLERASVLGRASLLDWVIDPLADWLEAPAVGPELAAEVRPQKERTHRRALTLYRSLYGRG